MKTMKLLILITSLTFTHTIYAKPDPCFLGIGVGSCGKGADCVQKCKTSSPKDCKVCGDTLDHKGPCSCVVRDKDCMDGCVKKYPQSRCEADVRRAEKERCKKTPLCCGQYR